MYHRYSKKEEQIIRKHWKEGPDEVLRLLRSECMVTRNRAGLVQKAKRMKLKRRTYHEWTQWELDLIQNSKHRGLVWMVNVIKKETGKQRTTRGIQTKLNRLRQAT